MNKAFTLVELLAVIAILAIILFIAVPKVLNTINDSKKSSFTASAQLLAKAGSNYLYDNYNDIAKPTNGTGIIVTTSQLKSSGYIKSTSGIANSVIVIYNNNSKYEVYTFATDGTYIVDGYTEENIKSNVKTASINYSTLITSSTTYCSSGSKLSVNSLDTSCANAPEMSSNMIPIYYDSANSVWKKADVTNTNATYKWYSYANKMWANAVTVTASTLVAYQNATVGTTVAEADILTYLVWIPRYKYLIPIGSGARQITIAFENASANKSTGDAITTYRTHPAFTFGTEELNGIWVGKFEATGTSSLVTTKPDIISLTNLKVATYFTAIRNMEVSGNAYNFDSKEVDTHMMLNSEWGAVAYLSYSIYGLNGEVYKNNSSNLYTGRSGGNVGGSQVLSGVNEYISGGYYTYNGKCATTTTIVPGIDANCTTIGNTISNLSLAYNASTTGTIYGIYDMVGGNWEYVMNDYNNYSGYSVTQNSGFNGPTGYDSGTYTAGIPFPESKYYNVYTTTSTSTACNGNPCYGFALGETAGWNNDDGNTTSNSSNSSYPWQVRGELATLGTNKSGIFSYSAGSGSGWSTRVVVTLE